MFMAVTCSSTIYKEDIVAFPRQWLDENVKILRYTYSSYLDVFLTVHHELTIH